MQPQPSEEGMQTIASDNNDFDRVPGARRAALTRNSRSPALRNMAKES